MQVPIGTDEIQYQYRNIGKHDDGGVNSNLSLNVMKGWDINLFINEHYKYYHGSYPDIAVINSNGAAFFGRLTNDISLPLKMKMSITAWYSSPEVYAQRSMRSMYSINMGLNRTILNKKVTLGLDIEDLFNSYKERLEIRQPNLYTVIDRRYEGRTFTISARYNFHTGKHVSKLNKKSSTDEERRRIE